MNQSLVVGLVSLGIEKKKISREAQDILKGVVDLFVRETLLQSDLQSKQEGESVVRVEHVEKVLPRLMMEF